MRWKIAQYFEIGWWKRYLHNRNASEYLVWKRSYWLEFLENIEIKPNPSDQILDAGCGPAGIFITPNDNQVDCVDPLIEQYKKLEIFKPSDHANCRFITKQIESIDDLANYDVCFCINVINHIQDLSKAWSALSNAIKPHGKLIISIDCHRFSFFKWLFRALPFDILHPHQYDVEAYKRMAKSAGFETSRILKLNSNFFFDYFVLICEKN